VREVLPAAASAAEGVHPQGLKAPKNLGQGSNGNAEQAAEELFRAVILSVAKDLALCIFNTMRDSASPAAPQNDSPDGFSRSL
jgi:hypothetical protein